MLNFRWQQGDHKYSQGQTLKKIKRQKGNINQKTRGDGIQDVNDKD